MKVSRRPPWYTDPGVPSAPPESEFRTVYFTDFPTDSESWLDYDRLLFQKRGESERLVVSGHLEFSTDEWEHGVLLARWVEVVVEDRATAFRASTAQLVKEKARYRRAKVEYVGVYWRAFRMDVMEGL